MTEAHDNTAELARQLNEVQRERDAYRSALQRIAEADYRGNRSMEQVIAHNALKAAVDRPEAPWLCGCGVRNHWQRTAYGFCDHQRPAP
jgi:hypothetical protein